MADATNLQMGVCSVSIGGTDIGHTVGGVEVTYEPEWQDVTVDKFGNTPVEKKLVGEHLKVKVPLAEYTLDNLHKAIINSTLAGSGNGRMTVGSVSGKSALDNAVQLVLHPQDAGVSRAYDVVLYKAVPISEVVLSHKVDETKVIEVEFEALIDESKTDGNYLGLFGDSAA